MAPWPTWTMDATDARRSPMMQVAPVREVWCLNPGRPLTAQDYENIVHDFRRALDSGDPHSPLIVAVPMVRAEMEIRLPSGGEHGV